MAQRDIPDLIICDIMMPELDGYGVLHILGKKDETARIPFIFLTAKTEKTDIRKGMNLGADDYLTKPFDDTELLKAIETRLHKATVLYRSYESNSAGLELFIKDARSVLNLADFGSGKKVKSYKKKAEVFAEGDMPLNVFYVKSGHVKLFKAHPDGKELITGLMNTNDFFGLEPILQGDPYQESAIALQDSELILIPKYDFIAMLQNIDISRKFIALLCKKVIDKEKQLINLAYNSVRQRTAEALLKAAQLKDNKDNISISREDLAKMVGTASESVIRVLSDFKEEGLIEVEATKIRLKSLPKLEKVVRWNVAL
jgi:CRP-like cAMP-binding protein